MTDNYSKSVYKLEEIFSFNQYDAFVLEMYYFKIVKKLNKTKYILEFGPGELKWFQYLYSKGFRKFIIIELDKSFYELQKKFLQQYNDIELIHLNENICDVDNYLHKIDIKNIELISSFQVIEHIQINDLQHFMKEIIKNYSGFFLLETINAQNIIQGNFAIYHDYTHKSSFTPRALKSLLSEVGSFDFIKTIGIGYPNLFDLYLLLRYKIKLDKKIVITLISNSFRSLSYFSSKLLSRFFIGRYVSSEDKIFDSGFSLFFRVKI